MARMVGHIRSLLEGGFADRNAAQVYRLSLRALWFFFPFGIPFVAFGLLPSRFSWTGSLVIGLYALTTLGSELRARSPARPILAFALLSAALFAVEYVGVTTGVPFGTYSYTDVLGGLVAGVPVAMALAWYVTVVSTWRIAQRLAGGPAGRSAVRVALLSGALTVILDVALEPMAAMITRYWVWEGDAVPAANYARMVRLLLRCLLAAREKFGSAAGASGSVPERAHGLSDAVGPVRADRRRRRPCAAGGGLGSRTPGVRPHVPPAARGRARHERPRRMKSEYLIVLAAIVLFPAILSRDPKIGIRGNWKPLVKAMGITCALFWAWDIIATARGHWSFNPAYVLGVNIAGMPIEEWLFFVVVSFVSVFTWEATKYFMRRQ